MLKREVIANTLIELFPNGGWGVDDRTDAFEKIYWQSGSAPISKETFLQVYAQAELKHNTEQILKNRKMEYPEIGDQLDDLFKAGAFSESMTARIQAVKDKYPKQ